MVLSPVTAPFSVCHPGEIGEIMGVTESSHGSAPHEDAFDTWLLHGGELGVEPTIPMATTIAAMATNNDVGIETSTSAAQAVWSQLEPFSTARSVTILVLRV